MSAPELGPPLPPLDVAGRLPRLREALGDHACDALVVTHLTNVRYLTGFTGSAGVLLVTDDRALLVTDGRYEERAGAELAASGSSVELAIGASADQQLETLATAAAGVSALGLEAAHVSWADQRRYADDAFSGVELVPTEDVVEDLRAVKDHAEVARIERASAIADAALGEVLDVLAERPTEASFARSLDAAMRRLGADDVSFPTIVASGPNGARPHHEPSNRQVERGDLVTIDFGALVEGYHSDMTRTVAVGGWDQVDDGRRRMAEVVSEAQAAGVAAVRAGIAARDVDAACRDVITAAGWGAAFVHGTGHGVGLDIHEHPRVGASSPATLQAGHVVTVEPGVYVPGVGGVRVEDTVVVTAAGCRPVTRAPKDPPPPGRAH